MWNKQMGAPPKQDWREARRRRAWELKQKGWPQKDIAHALGVSDGAVSQWLKRGRDGGEAALAAHPPTGHPPRISQEQLARLPQFLAQGAELYGFRGDIWTASRVAYVIAREYGITYHRDHVGKLLRRLGWSPQQPIVKASQRNEHAIYEWVEQRWPQIKKKRTMKGRTLLFVDEAAFYLLPMAVKTWAPTGQTPLLTVPLTHDHLSAISGITPDGRLFLQVRHQTYDGGRRLSVSCASSYARSGENCLSFGMVPPFTAAKVLKAFLAQGAARRIHFEQLPSYAPEMNPDEGIWQYLKRYELGNVLVVPQWRPSNANSSVLVNVWVTSTVLFAVVSP